MTESVWPIPSDAAILADLRRWLETGDVIGFNVEAEGPLNRDLVVRLRVRHNPDKAPLSAAELEIAAAAIDASMAALARADREAARTADALAALLAEVVVVATAPVRWWRRLRP